MTTVVALDVVGGGEGAKDARLVHTCICHRCVPNMYIWDTPM